MMSPRSLAGLLLGFTPTGLPHTPLYKLLFLTSLTVELAWGNGST